MRFCDICGSYMKQTSEGLQCSRCGKLIPSKRRVVQVKGSPRKRAPSDIFVVEKPKDSHAKVVQPCPKCGNREAFHWFSSISGEHAGIRRERTIEHFQCTKCFHNWTKIS